jgi:glycosyltransferase involved in cell wall biosynthesis
MSEQNAYSIAICFPVWNRPDLFQVSFASLLRQLEGIEASIWIFDNGSDAPTRELIEGLSSTEQRIFKVFLPQNMGIPFVVNIFSQIVTQDCDFAGYRAPSHVMVADSDAYFKKPIRDMIAVLESYSHFAVISGHDSIEHECVSQLTQTFRGEATVVKVKSIERGLCLIMRREILAACVPFPHHRDKDVDWELMKWHPNSVSARTRQLAVVDYVAHLGLYDSTWHPVGAPANSAEIAEINQILEREGLLSPERRARMENYSRSLKSGT